MISMLPSQVMDTPVITLNAAVLGYLLFTLFSVGGNPPFQVIHFKWHLFSPNYPWITGTSYTMLTIRKCDSLYLFSTDVQVGLDCLLGMILCVYWLSVLLRA
jgi:hypothetical protein